MAASLLVGPNFLSKDDVVLGLSSFPQSGRAKASSSTKPPLGDSSFVETQARKERATAEILKLLKVSVPNARPSLLSAHAGMLEALSTMLQIMSDLPPSTESAHLRDEISALRFDLRRLEDNDVKRCATIDKLR